VKIYVAALEALRKNERGGQNLMKLGFPQTKFGAGISEFRTPPHPLMRNVHFCRLKKKSHPVLDQSQGSGAVFSSLYGIL